MCGPVGHGTWEDSYYPDGFERTDSGDVLDRQGSDYCAEKGSLDDMAGGD